ncbi:hypothetical protein BJX62DRAFT_209711 [Aspergillus germanicus]
MSVSTLQRDTAFQARSLVRTSANLHQTSIWSGYTNHSLYCTVPVFASSILPVLQLQLPRVRPAKDQRCLPRASA